MKGVCGGQRLAIWEGGDGGVERGNGPVVPGCMPRATPPTAMLRGKPLARFREPFAGGRRGFWGLVVGGSGGFRLALPRRRVSGRGRGRGRVRRRGGTEGCGGVGPFANLRRWPRTSLAERPSSSHPTLPPPLPPSPDPYPVRLPGTPIFDPRVRCPAYPASGGSYTPQRRARGAPETWQHQRAYARWCKEGATFATVSDPERSLFSATRVRALLV